MLWFMSCLEPNGLYFYYFMCEWDLNPLYWMVVIQCGQLSDYVLPFWHTHTHNNTHLTTAFMVISHVLLNSACQLTQWMDLSMISTFLVRFFKRNPSIAVIWIITRICGHRNLHRFLHHLNVQEYQVTQILCMFVYEIFWIIWICFQLHWSVLKETYFAPFYKM